MDNTIILEFSGWCKIQASHARMQNTETDEIITGKQWLELPEEERDNYILEDAIATLRDSDDNEWIQLDFFKQEGEP